MNKNQRAIVCADNKGYDVKEDGTVISHRNNIISQGTNTNGYPYFSIKMDGERVTVQTHQLLAYQKFGKELFEEGIEVRHLNGDKTDNRWENIDIGTHSENIMDQPKHVRARKSKAGEKVGDKEALEIRQRVENNQYTTYQDLAEEYGVEMAPSFVVLDQNGDYKGVKFNGIPAGHEINSFLSALLDMSGVDYGFDQAVINRLKKINKPVNIKVFITLSCPHCPGAVQNAHRLAMLNENIEGEMIEAQTFQELSQKYNVSGVPKIVINGEHEMVGNQPLEQYLDHLENL